jgi:hypothetical protein
MLGLVVPGTLSPALAASATSGPGSEAGRVQRECRESPGEDSCKDAERCCRR